MLFRTKTAHSLFHFTLKPSIPKTLIFSRTCTATATVSPPYPSAPQHPWPEWVSFVDRLKSRGYFPNSSSGDVDDSGDSDLVYRDLKLLKDPCLSFARDHFDIFKSLSKDDIENVVEIGCPKINRKVVTSAKRLREYVGLEEKNVCDVCSLKGSCDQAYLKPNDSRLVQTVDVMRLLLFYAIHPTVVSGAVRLNNNEQVVSSARRLLSMLMDLSEASKSPVSEEILYKKEKIVNSAATVVSQATGTPKRDWACPKCRFLNFSKNSQCRECNADRPEMQGSAHADVMKGDWSCPKCSYLNFKKNSQCRECNEDRPEMQGSAHDVKKGDWICPKCKYVNFGRNISCLKCNEDVPRRHVELRTGDASRHVEPKSGDWRCRTCQYLNFAKNTQCRNCMEDDSEKKEKVHVELQKGDWNCPQCGSLNFSRRTVCFQCTTTRPPESLNPGEWVCSRCNFLNFRRNVKCLKCETDHGKPSR
ncbi:uncharacterized protein LOC141595697 isoform X2 [Silene latifolia]|uniref:uncharacterized protein LOC141595697 isoform X2 n=1 Tax=Silene latifolia TaxID=37657 RepID=UPI003D7806E6